MQSKRQLQQTDRKIKMQLEMLRKEEADKHKKAAVVIPQFASSTPVSLSKSQFTFMFHLVAITVTFTNLFTVDSQLTFSTLSYPFRM